ncbi:Calcium-transporting ATPase [Curvibacter sp. AEP1-3]|uniref:cation-translocating P-type ATPase n=1 Tax=Curvibacter sp. AEP1-3 TaxID=1844971 RepID=UPI000B580FCB|nr:cation-translocating P-type ATPase [Curvibacter sp. AEP1-3]ARV19272.1 Calcium-transporting ATPase [Curvibacter sp. AEP1-3]
MPISPETMASTADSTASQGLSNVQAVKLLDDHGPNALPGAGSRRWTAIARETLTEPMFLLLLGAAVLYGLLGDWQEGGILLGLVVMVVALTLYQEGKTEHAMQALRQLASPQAQVLRDGKAQAVPGSTVVPGDVLVLAEGDRVAADATLLSGSDVMADESMLSGESVPVEKAATGGDAALFGGTLLVRGHGLARVEHTGAASAMGRIGSALDGLGPEDSPLKQQTTVLVKRLAVVAFAASVLLILASGLMHGNWTAALLSGIALAMALLPQEFTVILTVLPALGAWRLAKQQVLTRRLAAIETLGATSVLCVDKTGTLTENRMRVAALFAYGGTAADQTLALPDGEPHALPEAFHRVAEYAILASVEEPFDPMEQAFHRLGAQTLQDTEHLHRDWTLVREYGLSPQLRAMSHVWTADDGDAHIVAAKGAPEAVFDLCHLPPAELARAQAAAAALADQGLRVLGVASSRVPGAAGTITLPGQEHDFDFTLLGLIGLEDPLRLGIADSVAECLQAGIRVVMITGDHPGTATAIAKHAGILTAATGPGNTAADEVLNGDDIDTLDDAALRERMRHTRVCARVAPVQKLRIVQALQAEGQIVAMTGDGVNDAPALKAAHVGIAMGQRGTDVARESAALVLLDDNFASITAAVRLGRRIFDNVRKSMAYVLAVHVPIAGMALLPVLLGWPTALFPLHIAFLELVIDPACSMVFENESAEQSGMQQPPRDVKAALLNRGTLWQALAQGVVGLLAVVGAMAWGLAHASPEHARTLAFATLLLVNLSLIFMNRSAQLNPRAWLLRPNGVLWGVCAVAMGVLLAMVYVPWIRQLAAFAALDAEQWAVCAVLVGLTLLACAGLKWAGRQDPTPPGA